MSISLDEKFIGLSSTPIITSEPILHASKTETPNSQNSKSGNNYLKRYALPLSLIAGGGILMYLGLKKPNKDVIFNKVIDIKIEEMKSHLNDFKNFAVEIVGKSFKGADKYIEIYKSNYSYNITSELEQIKKCSHPKDIIKKYKDAFKNVNTIYSQENNRQGSTIFDKFLASMEDESRQLSGVLWRKRCDKGLECEKITDLKFSDYPNNDNMAQALGKLRAHKYLTDVDLDSFRSKILDDEINSKSKNMAKAIKKSRTEYINSKHNILQASFDTMRKILNLPDDFIPTYKKVLSTENYEKLTPDELKAQKLPKNIKEMFKGNPIWNFVLSKDFSNIKKEEFDILFKKLTPDNSIEDIKIMIDSLRLNNEVDKALGKNEEELYKNSVAKLEKLAIELRNIGEEKLIKLLDCDYSSLKPEELKTKLYNISDISKKLGYPALKDMKESFLIQDQNFNTKPAIKYIDLVDEKPELYFS